MKKRRNDEEKKWREADISVAISERRGFLFGG